MRTVSEPRGTTPYPSRDMGPKRITVAALAVAALAVLATACGEGLGAQGTPDAAPETTSPDAAAREASDDAGSPFGTFGDATPDTYVVWCDAGPPRPGTLGTCTLPVLVPCGLPPGIVASDAGGLSATACAILCPAGNSYDGCYVEAPDAQGPAGTLVQCVLDCT